MAVGEPPHANMASSLRKARLNTAAGWALKSLNRTLEEELAR